MKGTTGEISRREMRLVIGASSAGTIFEWYDFFIYGTLAGLIGKAFFPAGNETLQMLLVWAGFAVGFGFRPLGAVLFGYLGDRLGRKYTFLVTVTLMGVATAGVGLIPSAETIGIAAPLLVLFLRILQGLALGGEYGGAAVYVAEHSPKGRAGFFTSFIQASVVGGFVLSLIVVLGCKALIPADIWTAWGWRVPFLLSLILLAISLWMRFSLSESPVFKAMKEEGELAGNPLVESFTYPGNRKRIAVALFGIAAGLTVIWYTAMFSGLGFLVGPMRVEETQAQIVVGLAAAVGMGFFILSGHLSDRFGRKRVIVVGYVLTLLALFPVFWGLAAIANPHVTRAAQVAPVVVSGSECVYDPLASQQKTPCGQLLGELTRLGVPYVLRPEQSGSALLSVGADSLPIVEGMTAKPTLEAAGYDFRPHALGMGQVVGVFALLLALCALSGMTYGPVAALLCEMFPPAIRYSSLSIPYHIGTGYFGGFLPLIASYIVASTGDPFAGLWYTFAVVAMALIVCLWGLREPSGRGEKRTA